MYASRTQHSCGLLLVSLLERRMWKNYPSSETRVHLNQVHRVVFVPNINVLNTTIMLDSETHAIVPRGCAPAVSLTAIAMWNDASQCCGYNLRVANASMGLACAPATAALSRLPTVVATRDGDGGAEAAIDGPGGVLQTILTTPAWRSGMVDDNPAIAQSASLSVYHLVFAPQ